MFERIIKFLIFSFQNQACFEINLIRLVSAFIFLFGGNQDTSDRQRIMAKIIPRKNRRDWSSLKCKRVNHGNFSIHMTRKYVYFVLFFGIIAVFRDYN